MERRKKNGESDATAEYSQEPNQEPCEEPTPDPTRQAYQEETHHEHTHAQQIYQGPLPPYEEQRRPAEEPAPVYTREPARDYEPAEQPPYVQGTPVFVAVGGSSVDDERSGFTIEQTTTIQETILSVNRGEPEPDPDPDAERLAEALRRAAFEQQQRTNGNTVEDEVSRIAGAFGFESNGGGRWHEDGASQVPDWLAAFGNGHNGHDGGTPTSAVAAGVGGDVIDQFLSESIADVIVLIDYLRRASVLLADPDLPWDVSRVNRLAVKLREAVENLMSVSVTGIGGNRRAQAAMLALIIEQSLGTVFSQMEVIATAGDLIGARS